MLKMLSGSNGLHAIHKDILPLPTFSQLRSDELDGARGHDSSGTVASGMAKDKRVIAAAVPQIASLSVGLTGVLSLS